MLSNSKKSTIIVYMTEWKIKKFKLLFTLKSHLHVYLIKYIVIGHVTGDLLRA